MAIFWGGEMPDCSSDKLMVRSRLEVSLTSARENQVKFSREWATAGHRIDMYTVCTELCTSQIKLVECALGKDPFSNSPLDLTSITRQYLPFTIGICRL
jgi:hypothetical protein